MMLPKKHQHVSLPGGTHCMQKCSMMTWFMITSLLPSLRNLFCLKRLKGTAVSNSLTISIRPTKKTFTKWSLLHKKASKKLASLEKENKLEWAKYKNTTVYHLLKTNAMAFAREGLMNGGGNGIINASQHDHGPSWRMVVEMTSPTKAYGVYPGGQSGNPGSKFYDNFIDKWTKGDYYRLWFMESFAMEEKKCKWKMSFASK